MACLRLPKSICLLLAVTAALASPSLRAETLVAWDVSTRLTLAFRAPANAVQKWLPEGWTIAPIPAGPSKGANLVLAFVERMLNLDPEGKPISGGIDRYLGLVVPALKPGADKPANLVIRLYQSNPAAVPGAYKNAVPASVSRTQHRDGLDTGPADGSEDWKVDAKAAGTVTVHLKYRGGPLVRSRMEPRYYSAIDPEFYRIYRFEQAVDTVKSTPAGVDRADEFTLKIGVDELHDLFDGTEDLVSINVTPSYSRQVFLP